MSGQDPPYTGYGAHPYPLDLDHELLPKSNDNEYGVYDTNNNATAPDGTPAPTSYAPQAYYDSQTGGIMPSGFVHTPPFYPPPTTNTSMDVNVGEEENNVPWQTSVVPAEGDARLPLQPGQGGDPRVSDTESFVIGRQNSYDKHEEFLKDAAGARERRLGRVGETVSESCRKYDGTSKKKGGHGDGGGCKPTDKKHHRHDHHGGGGASGHGSSSKESNHKESNHKESSRKESSRKESKGKESKGRESKGKGSSSKSH